MAREKGISTGGQKPYGFRYYEELPNGKKKRVQFLSLDQTKDDSGNKIGEKDVKILILDEAPPGGENEWQPSIYIHERFKFNGGWDNYSVCRQKTPEGCLLDEALQQPHRHGAFCKDDCDREGKPQRVKGRWRWICSGIKLKPYTIKSGPNQGKVIPYTRGLILMGEDQFKDLLAYRKAFKGLRGRLFNVSRGDGQMAPRVGDSWDPVEEWSDEKMMEHFADAAADYGLPVEDYIKPFDYEKLFKLPSEKEIAEIARWVAGERGVKLGAMNSGGGAPAPNPVAAAVADTADEESEDDVPF